MNKLSVVIISKNSEDVIQKAFESIKKIADEIILVDQKSKDNTVKIAKKFKAKIFFNTSKDLGKLKRFGVNKATHNLILILDTDERVSKRLEKEIMNIKASPLNYDGFVIPFQNHLFGQPIKYGGENYAMLRLFKKEKAHIKDALVHEKVELKGKIKKLKGKIYHYSYRSLIQMFTKFTNYAIREAKQKFKKRERLTFKKLTAYPLHMFWARYIEDKGYKDGFKRIILDIGFAYMEFLTYLMLLMYKIRKKLKIPHFS